MIIQKVQQYEFSGVEWNPAATDNHVFDPKFLISFRAVPDALDGLLLRHSAIFSVAVADKKKDSPENFQFNCRRQNYFSCADPDGGCRVIEAILRVEGDPQPYRIGFPLALLENRNAEHEFAVLFDGVYFEILCDGVVLDRDSPLGPPLHHYEEKLLCRVISPAVKGFRIADDLAGIRRAEREIRRDIAIQYYTPGGFNTWVGDVVPCYYKDRFHLFYLHDRRHHGSRRGRGAHEFWHLSSPDLKEWTDHGPVFELEELWQSVGTGNAFEFQGKLHLSFGWHTERARKYPETANLLFHRHLLRFGNTGEFRYAELGTLIPGGASYVSSEDGLHFVPSRKLIHYLENPSIFVQPDGKLHLCQDGIWESDHPGSWRLIDPDFPPRGEKSFARNCLDCPTFFKLDGWEYFMIGFTGFWGRPDRPDAAWIDFVECGWDTYDGTNVPMAASFRDGRVVEGGWLGGLGWGGCLLLREFVAPGNGRLGKKWVEESLPEFGAARNFEYETTIPPVVDALLEFEIEPADDRLSVVLEGEGIPCEFQLDLAMERAQWSAVPDGTIPAAPIPTYREQLLSAAGNPDCPLERIPTGGRDFSQEQLFRLHEPFRLRLLIHADPKLNSVILDAEIAGTRTMATQRTDLAVSSVRARFIGGNAKLRSASLKVGKVRR